MTEEIYDLFKMNEVEYRRDVSFSEISAIKIGGKAEVIAYPNSIEKLIFLLRKLKEWNIRYKILGRTSNVLPPDYDYKGIIVRTDQIKNVSLNGNFITADAGVSLPFLATYSARKGLSGLEELSGIPGSLGGAVRGNAGAFGREIFDLINKVKVYDPLSNKVEIIKAQNIKREYRYSEFINNSLVILSVRLKLSESDCYSLFEKIIKYREIRRKTQPVGEPSLGSVFKRPGKDIYAAGMIEECGLKGTFIGGAKISEKHAGFIVNSGSATASDYLLLADYAAKCVFDKFGIALEREFETI